MATEGQRDSSFGSRVSVCRPGVPTLAQRHKFQGSMSHRGQCWDQAVGESFFGSLKQERAQCGNDQARDESQQDTLNDITMFYH